MKNKGGKVRDDFESHSINFEGQKSLAQTLENA